MTKVEIDKFIAMGPERKVGLVTYFEKYDTDNDEKLSEKELALVEPSFAFDGTDSNADGIVSRRNACALIHIAQFQDSSGNNQKAS